MIETRVNVAGIGSDVPVGICCETMVEALKSGNPADPSKPFAFIDLEGVTRLRSKSLPQHSFCPWCGKNPTVSFGLRREP